MVQITGAKIDKIGSKFYVVFQEQIVGCFRDKIDALSLALDRDSMSRMLRKNNNSMIAHKTIDKASFFI